jgi:hypothetical protein
MFLRNTENAFGARRRPAHHAIMDGTRKHSDEHALDEALQGTFPASDPVSPGSHVEEEMERRRKVLEQDAKRKRRPAARKKTPGKKIAGKKKTQPARKRAGRTARRR